MDSKKKKFDCIQATGRFTYANTREGGGEDQGVDRRNDAAFRDSDKRERES